MFWLPSWKPKSNDDALIPVNSHTASTGIIPLLCYWSYIGIFNSFVLSVLPFFVRQTIEGHEYLFPISITTTCAALGSVLGGIMAGNLTNKLGEIAILMISSTFLMLAIGGTMWLIPLPFTYLWMVVGFAYGISDGTS